MNKKVAKNKKNLFKKVKESWLDIDLGPDKVVLGNLTFIRSSLACPEAYDVINSTDEYIAYVRVRHGDLSVYEAPDLVNEIYYAELDDWHAGSFKNTEQRIEYLNKVAIAINDYFNSGPY